jgi:glycogen debranching enzyme
VFEKHGGMSAPVNLTDTTVVKAHSTFCVALRDGRLPIEEDHPLGLYMDDCRHLRGHELRLGGELLRLLVASDAPGSGAVFELSNPELELDGGSKAPMHSMRIRLERRMVSTAMFERIVVQSFARERLALELELRLDADFRPMLEIRGIVSPAARDVRQRAEGDTLTFSATGLDGGERSTRISCPGSLAQEDGRIRVPMSVGPGEERTVEVRFTLETPDRPHGIGVTLDGRRDERVLMSDAAAEADAWLANRPSVEVDDQLVARVLRRSLLDLRLLASDLDGLRYYAAGIPWYATLFGRDSIIAALQALAFDTKIAEETLRLHASLLGTRLDDEHDEEPGKVIHELRPGEVAAEGLTPLARYYGTVDATPLFLCLLCEHTDWTGTLDLFRELRPQVEAAVNWIDTYGDLDGDGLLEYRCRSSAGLVNQGWKDSWDGVVDEHGMPSRAPIALVEAQGYALRAKRCLARLYERDGDAARARELRQGAARLAGALERFWLADRNFYSMALDADKRPSGALASNQGHLLWALAVPPERGAAIRDALMSREANSGWGVRTLGSGEPAFNPVGYHTGTVWPHDNALFAVGLRKYGFDEEFLRVSEGLLDAAAHFAEYRLPELFAGFTRAPYEEPVPYPVACSPQAWAAGALPFMLTSGLGLVPDGLERTLRIRRPSLPRHVARLELQGLRLAGARIDLLFERAGRAQGVALTDVQVDGDVDVVLEIPPGRDQVRPPTLEDVSRPGEKEPGRAGATFRPRA